MNPPEKTTPSSRLPEPEHKGPFYTHPYFLYVFLTLVLFLFLVFMGWLAIKYDWLPKR